MYLTTRKQFRRTTIVIMSIYLSIPSLERLCYIYIPDFMETRTKRTQKVLTILTSITSELVCS